MPPVDSIVTQFLVLAFDRELILQSWYQLVKNACLTAVGVHAFKVHQTLLFPDTGVFSPPLRDVLPVDESAA